MRVRDLTRSGYLEQVRRRYWRGARNRQSIHPAAHKVKSLHVIMTAPTSVMLQDLRSAPEADISLRRGICRKGADSCKSRLASLIIKFLGRGRVFRVSMWGVT
jgi:hypothetical protein